MAKPKKKSGPRRPRSRPKKSGGGMLMGMRSGFRKMTGADKGAKAAKPSNARRAMIIGIGVLIAVALVWGLAQR